MCISLDKQVVVDTAKEEARFIQSCYQKGVERAKSLLDKKKIMRNFNLSHWGDAKVSKYLASVEIEFSLHQDKTRDDIQREMEKSISKDLFCLHHDGSGCEEITFQVQDWNNYKRTLIDTFCLLYLATKVLKDMKCSTDERCGGHIHIDFKNIDAESREILFEMLKEKFESEDKETLKLTERKCNRWCNKLFDYELPEFFTDEDIKNKEAKVNNLKESIYKKEEELKRKKKAQVKKRIKAFYKSNEYQIWKSKYEDDISHLRKERAQLAKIIKNRKLLNDILGENEYIKDVVNKARKHYHYFAFQISSDNFQTLQERFREWKARQRKTKNRREIEMLQCELEIQENALARMKENKMHISTCSRYKAVNLQSFNKYGSVEVRRFSGTIDLNKIRKRIATLLIMKATAINQARLVA